MSYENWVAEVQRILLEDWDLPPNSCLLEPHDGSPALRSWQEMFDIGTSAEQMAEWTYYIFD